MSSQSTEIVAFIESVKGGSVTFQLAYWSGKYHDRPSPPADRKYYGPEAGKKPDTLPVQRDVIDGVMQKCFNAKVKEVPLKLTITDGLISGAKELNE